jgi:hypothetical protein
MPIAVGESMRVSVCVSVHAEPRVSIIKVMLKVFKGWLRHLVLLAHGLTSISFVFWVEHSTKPITGQGQSVQYRTAARLIKEAPFAIANILAHCFVNSIGNVQ